MKPLNANLFKSFVKGTLYKNLVCYVIAAKVTSKGNRQLNSTNEFTLFLVVIN